MKPKINSAVLRTTILTLFTTFATPSVAAAAADQDLNCNGLSPPDEPLVDLEDPLCRATEDEHGIPYENGDYYIEYLTFGCAYPVLELGLDEDGDLFGSGTVAIDEGGALYIVLDCDSCPTVANNDQAKYRYDEDSWGDACDNCIYRTNEDQADADADGVGDTCDNCPSLYNPDQSDRDDDGPDGIGDACDSCVDTINPAQADWDVDGVGDECDNCYETSNPDQTDADLDRVGDACDNCPGLANTWQQDSDIDGFGDECDNCPNTENPEQADSDGDLEGDACEGGEPVDSAESCHGCTAGPAQSAPAGLAIATIAALMIVLRSRCFSLLSWSFVEGKGQAV